MKKHFIYLCKKLLQKTKFSVIQYVTIIRVKLLKHYIHTYMHTCIHAYMHTCIHAYMQMCPPGYHYIAIVIPALRHRDVRLHIHWLNLSNDITYIVSAKQFKRFQAPKPECSNCIKQWALHNALALG